MAGPWEKYGGEAEGPWSQYAKPPEQPASVTLGNEFRAIPRQVGLTGRYVLEGAPQFVDTLAAPVKMVTDKVYGLATGRPDFRSATLSETGRAVADAAGLPSPETPNERTVGAASRGVAAAGGSVGLVRMLAARAPALAQDVMNLFAARPGMQGAAGAGGGGAGQAVKESGGSPFEQFVASIIGGVAAPVAVQTLAGAGQAVANRLPGLRPSTSNVDQTIEIALRREGVNWGEVNERVRQAVRQDVQEALSASPGLNLDPASLRRLVDFRAVQGVTPTRGSVTLDPVQITREKNLGKIGANSQNTDLQRLANVEAGNNRALIANLNDAGAAPTLDPVRAGQSVVTAGQRSIDAEKAGVDALYATARGQAGRNFSLDGAAFTSRANSLLDDALLQSKLPEDVRAVMNRISSGQMPLTVDVAEQLKTRLGDLQRSSSDGQVRQALRIVRTAIDDAPVVPMGERTQGYAGARQVSGGLPVAVGDTQAGEEAVAAFNRARAANRAMMGRIEGNPVLAAIDDGAQPDKIIEQFVLRPAATVRDAEALRQVVAKDPEALGMTRAHILTWLKEKALSGATDEVGNFSQSRYNAALKSIGERKLTAFFDPEEIGQLQRIGRVASYTQAQPRGSAVNNSNSGALVAGGALDALDRIAARLPVGRDTVQAMVRSRQQAQAVDVAPSIVQPAPAGRLRELAGPASATGLIVAPGVVRGDEDRRNR